MSLSVFSPSSSYSVLSQKAWRCGCPRSGAGRVGNHTEHVSAFPNRERRSPGKVFCLRTEEPKVQKTDRSLFDNASNVLTNLLSAGSIGGMPVAEGAVSDLFDRPLFYALYDWFIQHGPVYKLAFGPKAFVVVSDPIVARHILRENAFGYDKGVLADILEPIMGKGLIPADLDTWKVRRRAIVPGFHAAYLGAMVQVFDECSERTIQKFERLLSEAEGDGRQEAVVEMESEFSSLALDIIGLSVFNYDFGSVTEESPVIRAVYGTLSEAEHRSTFYIPYWKFPLSRWLVPRQRKFQEDLKVINECLDSLIQRARDTRQEEDIEALQQRDYTKVKDASLLRFLVDMRGEDTDDKQLRDDLMTMLIAGHETTAAVLTWATYMLAQNPTKVAKAQKEIDTVLGGKRPTYDDLKKLQCAQFLLGSSAENEQLFWPSQTLAAMGSQCSAHDPRFGKTHRRRPAQSVLPNFVLELGKDTSFPGAAEVLGYEVGIKGCRGTKDWQSGSLAQEKSLAEHKDSAIFSFGVITDVQYADIPDGYSFAGVPRYYRHSLEVLNRAVSHWNLKGTLNFAVHFGDIVDGFCPKPEALTAVTRVVGAFDKFTGRLYHMLGNHCFYNLPREDLNRILGIPASQDGLSYYDFCPTSSFRIVVLDGYDISALGWPEDHPHTELANSLLNSKNPNEEKNSPEGLTGNDRRFVKFNGGIGAGQLTWLEDSLQKATFLGQKVITLCHLPLNPAAASPTALLWNYDEVMQVIHKYDCVVACLAGHAHRGGYAVDSRGIHHRTLEAVLECPPGTDAFGHIDVYDDHLSLVGIGRVASTEMYIRLIVAESLRLYPQPPLLIRRSLRPDTLPGGNKGEPDGYSVPAGTDIFISVYNLHRSPFFWKEPDKFEPERFLEARPSDVPGWDGFDPNRAAGGLYPNEVMADFAFLPFGGGPRKCVGDQFALMESTVGLVKLLQKYDVELRGSPDEVELVTGATLHTKSGLWCKLRRRQAVEDPQGVSERQAAG